MHEEIKIQYHIINQFSFADSVTGLYDKLYDVTKSIETTYPSHRNWFYVYFIGNLLKNKKAAIVFATNIENGEIAGVSFLNTEIGKLNTLFVNPYYRRRGVANQLLIMSEDILGKKPIVTVAEENLSQLQALFEKRGYNRPIKLLAITRPANAKYALMMIVQKEFLIIRRNFMMLLMTD